VRRLCPAAFWRQWNYWSMMVDAPDGLRRQRMELGGQIQRWRWSARGGADRWPIGGGAVAGRGGSGSVARATCEAQRPRLLLLPPFPLLASAVVVMWRVRQLLVDGGVEWWSAEGRPGRPEASAAPASPFPSSLLTATTARWLRSVRRRWHSGQQSPRGSLGG
jgi:hypothetical protein